MIFNDDRTAGMRKCFAALSLLFIASLCCAGCKKLKTSATFTVETEPAKARIYLNGKYVGLSPCKVKVKDKGNADHWERHKIEAQLAGYDVHNYEVSYRTGSAWVPSPVKLELIKSKNYKPWKGDSKKVATSEKNANDKEPATEVKNNDKKITIAKNIADDKDKPKKNIVKKNPKDDIAKTSPVDDKKKSKKVVKKIKPAKKLNKNQNFLCELRLVRVSDGKVITQQSAMASVKNARKLAIVLIDKISSHLPEDDVPIASICLCNRRRSSKGQRLSMIMSKQVEAALLKSDQFDRVVSVDLRSLISNELKLENAKTLTSSTVEALLEGAKYMIIGGVALQKSPKSLSRNDTHYGSVKRRH